MLGRVKPPVFSPGGTSCRVVPGRRKCVSCLWDAQGLCTTSWCAGEQPHTGASHGSALSLPFLSFFPHFRPYIFLTLLSNLGPNKAKTLDPALLSQFPLNTGMKWSVIAPTLLLPLYKNISAAKAISVYTADLTQTSVWRSWRPQRDGNPPSLHQKVHSGPVVLGNISTECQFEAELFKRGICHSPVLLAIAALKLSSSWAADF